MAQKQTPLYIGTGRHVAALDARTGEELWRTRLPHSGSPVSLIIKGPNIYVGAGGYAYCIDKRYGEIIWENGLKRMGFQAVLMAMEGAAGCSSHGVAAAEVERQRRQQAAFGRRRRQLRGLTVLARMSQSCRRSW